LHRPSTLADYTSTRCLDRCDESVIVASSCSTTLILVIALTPGVLAQSTVDFDRRSSLATARELYAAAEYQGALEISIGWSPPTSHPPIVNRSICIERFASSRWDDCKRPTTQSPA